MRLYSTPESVDRGEPTVLAVIETILAIGLSIWLAIYLGTVRYIAVSACVAPLLLLRTERSTRIGIEIFARWFPDTLKKSSNAEKGPWIVLFFLLQAFVLFVFMAVGGPVSRIAATLFTAVTRPRESLLQVPQNWNRVTMCVDSLTIPEVVPGFEEHIADMIADHGNMDIFPFFPPTFSQLVESLREDFKLKKDPGTSIAEFIAVCLMYLLPAVIYRWSLKATSLIYLPLIWIAWTATRPFESLSRELKNLYRGELAQFGLLVSGVVVITFTLKFFGMVLLLEMQDWWAATDVAEFWTKWTNDTEMGRLADRLVVPDRIPVWHIASFVNAVMAFGLAGFAKRLCSDDYDWNVRGRTIYRVLRASSVTRVGLSCYTIGVSLYITLSTVEALELPQIGEWLPIN